MKRNEPCKRETKMIDYAAKRRFVFDTEKWNYEEKVK